MVQTNIKSKLPADWEVVRLEEVVNFVPGFSFPASRFNEDRRGMPVIKTGDIANNSTEQFYDGEYEEKYVVNPGDILIGLSGTIVAGKWCGLTALLNQRVVKLDNFSPNVLKDFISYSLPRILKEFERSLWKAAVKNVLKYHLEGLEIALPSLPEQQKIVYVLDTIQEAIGVQEKLIEKTKELKRAMMAKLFREGTRGEKLKKTEIGEIPESWEVVKFPEVVYFQEGPGLRNYQFRDEGVPFLNIQCLKEDGTIDFEKIQYLDPIEVEKKYKHFLLEAGDLIVSSSGTLGRIAEVRKEYLPLMLNTSVIRMRPKNNKVDRGFLRYFILSFHYQSQIVRMATGAAQLNYGPSHLKQMYFLLPLVEEQHEIAEILQTIDQKLEIEQKKKVLYEGLFRAMMAKLMTGEIRVKDIEFE